MANAITIFRMAASIVLLFCPAFSPAFYVFYIAAGVSDMLDGYVARKTNTDSRFGARLDTIADYVFVIVCLIKLLPVIRIPIWLYVWTGIIALTLYADGVWPDYNSDYAFTSVIVVKPFEDGTFRILSNDVTEQELRLPPVAYSK